ncbi:MAG: hypothetical protein OXC07_01620 [Kistimonas sp.]|nr:hypothetical protein [Kistimonas sp.]
MRSYVACQVARLREPLRTTFERADIGLFSGMGATVIYQGGPLAKSPLATFKRAGKGTLTGMYLKVRVEGCPMPEPSSTNFKRAGIGPLSSMASLVYLQAMALGESLATTFKWTDIGLFAGVDAPVASQVIALGEPPVTAFNRADKGSLSGMRSKVSCQHIFSAKRPLATFKRAGVGAGVAAIMGDQATPMTKSFDAVLKKADVYRLCLLALHSVTLAFFMAPDRRRQRSLTDVGRTWASPATAHSVRVKTRFRCCLSNIFPFEPETGLSAAGRARGCAAGCGPGLRS